MPTYDVECEITYRATVQVDARTRQEARAMAERGPAAWYSDPPHLEHAHTEALDAWRQGGEAGTDEMQDWKDRRDGAA